MNTKTKTKMEFNGVDFDCDLPRNTKQLTPTNFGPEKNVEVWRKQKNKLMKKRKKRISRIQHGQKRVQEKIKDIRNMQRQL